MAVERYTLTSTSKTSGFFISMDICYRIKNFPILLFLTTFFFFGGGGIQDRVSVPSSYCFETLLVD